MKDTTPAIEFRNVSISFDEKRALDDLSFRLENGEMICVTGISGSGKSVLLRVAAGLLAPDAGEVFVGGQPIGGLTEPELLSLRSASLGIVFQEPSLFTAMSVYDNTAYRLDEHDTPAADTDRAVREILRFVGLEDDIDKLPEELSIGMGRRLEFARALVGWPRIMLFDEPTAGLDPINNRIMLDLVIRARDIHQMSSIYVTKELHEIPYLAGHYASKQQSGEVLIKSLDAETKGLNTNPESRVSVMVLEDGQIAFLGSPAEFQISDLPAVTRLTHPDQGAPHSDTYIADPWSNTRKSKSNPDDQ